MLLSIKYPCIQLLSHVRLIVARNISWCVLRRFSHVRLRDPKGCTPPGCSGEHWSELPCPPSRDLPDPGIEPESLTSAYADGFFTTRATWEAP